MSVSTSTRPAKKQCHEGLQGLQLGEMDVRHPTQHGGAGSLQLETRSHRRDTHLRFECQRHEAQVQSNRQIHKEQERSIN